MIDDYHTSIVQFQCTVSDCLNVILERKKRFRSNVLFVAVPDAILQIFSAVGVNSILFTKPNGETSIGNSFRELYLEKKFASVRSLANVSLNTLNQDRYEK